MGRRRFAVNMIKNDKKQSLFYIMAIALSVALLFNIFNIIYNDSLLEFQKEYMGMFNGIAIVLMIVAAYLSFFASSFFLLSKTKELGIAGLSGVSTYGLGSILFYQTFILMFFAIIIGLGVGIITSPLFLGVMFRSANLTGEIMSISKEGIMMTLALTAIICAYIVLFNCGYAYRSEIIDLVNAKKNVAVPDTRSLKIPKTIYLVIFLLPLVLLFYRFSQPGEAMVACMVMVLSSYGTQGVIRYFIPYKILELKKEKYFDDKIKIMSLSNVYYSLKKSIPLVLMLAISSTVFITLIISNSTIKPIQLLCIFTYGLVTILLAISIIYKVLIETYNRRGTFVQLKLIGYSKKQIIKIIFEEIIMFNILIIGAPLFHITILLITFIKDSLISSNLAIILLLIFVSAYILSAVASFFGYKKMIIDHLYGGN